MKTFTKHNLVDLRADIDAALLAVSEKHGITIHAGNASFGPTEVTYKLKAEIANLDIADTQGGRDWIEYTSHGGTPMKPEWLGENVVLQGRKFQIVGINYKASKNRVMLSGGASCPISSIVLVMGRKEAQQCAS